MIERLRIFRTARQQPVAALAAVGVALLIAIAAGAPWIAPYDPLALHDALLSAPSWTHPMGTDQLGRDVLSRVIFGSRLALGVALPAVGVALILGGGVGLAAGYFRGWVDAVISRLLDVMFALPEILLALVVMAVVGVGLGEIALAIAIVYTPIFARVCRAATLRAAAQPYVEAAEALALSSRRIMLRHVLPNCAGPLIVQTTLSLAFAVLAEAALSFLGLSGQTDAPSWGLMLRKGKDLMELAWWVAFFPGLAITLTVLAFNVLGDGLNDLLDPQRVGRS